MGSGSLLGDPSLETDHVCSHCGDPLFLLEEVLLLQVVYPNRTDKGDCFFAVENESGNDFEYEPQFFHLTCWEELTADLDALQEDSLPFISENDVWECDVCSSSISPWEVTGMIEEGELRTSQRSPDNSTTVHFDSCSNKPRLYCAFCIRVLDEELFDMWRDFSHNGECPEGTRQRCWRLGTCRFGCAEQRRAAE